MFIVDEFGKATISLGGVCRLGCGHCYTMTRAFKHAPSWSVNDVMEWVHNHLHNIQIACVSGDTDPFLREQESIHLLRRLVDECPAIAIMFTTRLLPSASAMDAIVDMAGDMRHSERVFLACVSLVTYSYPNAIERADRVPSSAARLELIAQLANRGVQVVVALRPTFPFSVVPADEVERIIQTLDPEVIAVLGEVLLLDREGMIERRLGLAHEGVRIASEGQLTFLDQPASWRKLMPTVEVEFTKHVCNERGFPFYLRSASAVALAAHGLRTGVRVGRNVWPSFEVANVLP